MITQAETKIVIKRVTFESFHSYIDALKEMVIYLEQNNIDRSEIAQVVIKRSSDITITLDLMVEFDGSDVKDLVNI